MPQNEKLKRILYHSRRVCLVKMDAVEKAQTTQRTDVQQLQADYQKLFGHFFNPKLWEQAISFDAGKIAEKVLKVDSCDPTDLTTYLQHSRQLLAFLKNDLLASALQRIATTQTSMWNTRMLNALRITLQQEDERVVFFNNQGADLDNNSSYQELSTEQQLVVAAFRELLTTNAIESSQAKVNHMKTRGDMIASSTEVSIFLRLYKKLNAFIKAQIKEAATDLPDPTNPPSQLNEQALYILATCLLEIAQKTTSFESQGTDLNSHTAYQTEATRQSTAVSDYRLALEENTLDATDTEISSLKTRHQNLQSASSFDDFVKELGLLNTFMENAMANIS